MMAARRPIWMPLTEATGIAALGILLALLATRLAGDVRGPAQFAIILTAGVLGYLAADFLSGTAHWFCDTFYEEDTPIIGSMLIHPFREHHRDPRKMTEHSFLELTGNSALALVPVAALALWIREKAEGSAAGLLEVFGDAFVLALCVGLFATNLFHKWAHTEHPARWVTWLQRLGLILAPDHHDGHHTAPNRKSYCVTSGWANRLTDRFRVFGKMEKILKTVGVPISKTVVSQDSSDCG